MTGRGRGISLALVAHIFLFFLLRTLHFFSPRLFMTEATTIYHSWPQVFINEQNRNSAASGGDATLGGPSIHPETYRSNYPAASLSSASQSLLCQM